MDRTKSGINTTAAGIAHKTTKWYYDMIDYSRIRYPVRTFLALLALSLLVAAPVRAADWIYLVAEGDNLWSLSEKYLNSAQDWQKVQRVNQLPDPNNIAPGTRLRIPMAWLRTKPAQARIVAVRGTAQLEAGGGKAVALEAGRSLSLGAVVYTGAASNIVIEFADGSLLTLEENSILRFDQLSAYGETGMVDSRLRLLKGRLETHVTPASGPGSRFEIYSPAAISAVRGTRYRIAALDTSDNDKAGSSAVEVTGGLVDVSDEKQANTVPIEAGYGTIVVAGSAPQTPQRLLSAPDLSAFPATIRVFDRELRWLPVEGAQRYLVQVSKSANFRPIQWQDRTDTARVQLPELEDGSYHIRVRGISASTLHGLDGVAQFAYASEPLPTPNASTTISADVAIITWPSHNRECTYEVQIASDPEFEHVIDKRQTPKTTIEVVRKGVGDRHIRVRCIDAEGHAGQWGATQTVSGIPSESWKWVLPSFFLAALLVL